MTNVSEGKRDFFVSFNQADRAWATWIAWTLEAAGYSVFFQDWDFKGNFVLEMDKAHTKSRRTLAVLSPDYLTSRFTAPEWAARFAQDATSEHDLLIPVRVRPCVLEGLLTQIVYVDLVGCGEEAARLKLLQRVEGIRLKPDEPPLFPGEASHEAVPEQPSFPAARPSNTALPSLWLIGALAAVVFFIVAAIIPWKSTREIKSDIPSKYIESKNCLDAGLEDNYGIQLSKCTKNPSQQWTIAKRLFASNIQIGIDNKCLGVVTPGDRKHPVAVHLLECNGGVNQHWEQENGQMVMRIKKDDKRCLDVFWDYDNPKPYTYNLSSINIIECADDDRPNQLWSVE